ncbi:MAG: HdeD family acid-resistance protein [Alphaproteobacteria bacterium]|nr:HdeD family acid-resistance protein [Alphaproteobacteria bacterium]
MTLADQIIGETGRDQLRRTLAKAVHDHWALFLIEGIVLVVLGSAAIVAPMIASVAIAIFVGWLLLIGGATSLVTTLVGYRAPGFWWALLSAILGIAAGALLIWSPIAGVFSLTFLLAAYFLADGFASIMFAIDHRRSSSRAWYWLLAGGVFDLLLAGVIIAGLPGTAAWAIGLIVGIDLIFGGWALLIGALRARSTEA